MLPVFPPTGSGLSLAWPHSSFPRQPCADVKTLSQHPLSLMGLVPGFEDCLDCNSVIQCIAKL